MVTDNGWPLLSYGQGKATFETIHLWTQIVGKIKLSLMPWQNHSWHVTLHFTATGFTTQLIPYGSGHFQIDFNFIAHRLEVTTSAGLQRHFPLTDISVAGFYEKLFSILQELGIAVHIKTIPSEMVDGIPFPEDNVHHTYIPQQAQALHLAFLKVYDVFLRFRAEFKGKSSPIHLFWGSFDLAYSRFCGRSAPLHPGGVPNLPDWVAQEAYSDEVSSSGFWPGSEAVHDPAFYAYIYPEPEGYKESAVQPAEAYYHPELREFILPYQAVQSSQAPEQMLLSFLRSTYNSCSSLAGWDRKSLEAINLVGAHTPNG